MPITTEEDIATKEKAAEFIEIHLDFGASIVEVTKSGDQYKGKAVYQ